MKPRLRFIVLAIYLAWLLPLTSQAFYNPNTGRWLSRDPIEENGGLNLVGMCDNDSIAKHDSLGRKGYTFKREVQWNGSECSELCYCDRTEFVQFKEPPILDPRKPLVIDPNNIIQFRLFYPEWETPEGCSCIFFGWDAEAFLKAALKGGYGLVCGCRYTR